MMPLPEGEDGGGVVEVETGRKGAGRNVGRAAGRKEQALESSGSGRK
jgi:hypothetical protein